MSLKTVCRLCLAMDAPMRVLADCELLEIYEKLISTSINSAHWPVLACYICISQLRKCHNLMRRSVKIDKLLTKLYQSGDILKDESLSMLSRVRNELSNDLCFTPVEIIAIDGECIEGLIKTEVKEESLSSQSTEEMEPSVCVGHLKCEGSDEAAVEAALNVECRELMDEGTIKDEVLEETLDIEEQELAYEDVQNEESEGAKCMKSIELKGVEPTENCEREKHEEQKTTLSADEDNVQKRPRTRSNVKLLSIGTSSVSCTKNVSNNSQVYKKSDTAINNSNEKNNINNDCNTDVDNRSNRDLNEMFICNNCGDMFDDKHLLIEHLEHHNVVIKNRDHRLSQRSILRKKQRFSKINVVNKRKEIRSGKNIFECEICLRKYSRKGNLEKHLRLHSEKLIQCEICEANFDKPSLLKMHLLKHTGEKPFECEICKVRFIHKNSLKVHMRNHTGEKPFECEICKDRFIRMGYLKLHLLKHTGEKPFECDICKVRFTHKSSIKTHMALHTGERLNRSSSLKNRLPIHTDEKPFECEICKQKIRRKGDLIRHLRIHTGEKPYECEICQFKSIYKRDLNRHLLTHTGEKPFECELCKVRFRQKNNLKLHLLKHTGEKQYVSQKLFVCQICKSTFTQSNNLKTHLLIHTGEKPFECEICRIRFHRKDSLKLHLQKHTGDKPFTCEICDVKFYQKSTLKSHLQTHTGEKPFECEICKARYYRKHNLKRHFRTHTGSKP